MEKQLPKGYFGIQRLNGWSHTLEDGAVKELVYAVDMWIEKNTGLIACITVSTEFYGRLKAAVGYDVFVLDTIIGDFPLFAHIDAKTPIEITPHAEHIQNSEVSDTLTPKGSPDFSETSYIRDDVKNTCENITCPVVEEADRRKAMINLKNAMLDGQLKEQLTARREIALQDCDANLAALLYRAKDRITELEAEVQKHNYGPFMVANPEIKTSEDMATKPALVIQHLKKCKNHAICNKPAEAERYEFCYDCWWAQDPRNPAVLKRGAQ